MPRSQEPSSRVGKAAASAVLQLGRRACIALIFLVVARELGPAGYGALAAGLAIAAVLAPLSGLGVDLSALRAVAHAPDSAGSVFLLALRRVIWSGVLLLVLASGAVHGAGPPEVSPWLFSALIAAELLPLKLTELVAKIRQGEGRIVRMGLTRFLPAFLRLLAAALLWWAPWGNRTDNLEVWTLLYLGAAVLAALLIVGDLWREAPAATAKVKVDLPLPEGLSFAGSVLGLRLLTDTDKVVVFFLATSPAGAGSYAAAYRLVELLLTPLAAWLEVIHSGQLVAAQRGDVVGLQREAWRTLARTLAGAGLLGLALWGFLPLLANRVLGPGFSAMVELSLPLCLMPIAIGLRMILNQLSLALGLFRARLLVIWCLGLLALLLNCLLVPSHGGVAAAWICTLCEALAALCLGSVCVLKMRKQRAG